MKKITISVIWLKTPVSALVFFQLIFCLCFFVSKAQLISCILEPISTDRVEGIKNSYSLGEKLSYERSRITKTFSVHPSQMFWALVRIKRKKNTKKDMCLDLKLSFGKVCSKVKPSSPIMYTNVTTKQLDRIKENSINVKIGWKREKSFPKCFKIHGACSQMDQDFHRFFYMTAAHHVTWAHRNIEIKRWSQIL